MQCKSNRHRFEKAFAIMAMTISIMGTSGIALATPYVHSEKLVGGAITTTDWNNIGDTLNGIDNSGGAGTSWGFGMTSTGTATIETAGGIIVNAGGADITGVVTADDGVVIDTITLDAATITDTATTGFSYAGDYSTNNAANDRWLVDKGYVDGAITSGVTASNGLTKTGADIQLGGTMTGNVTLLNQAFYNFRISNIYDNNEVQFNDDSTYITYENGNLYSFLSMDYNDIYHFVSDTVANFSVETHTTASNTVASHQISAMDSSNNEVTLDIHTTTGIVLTDTISNKGAVYAADYSANYTDRSLVDKGYVDGEITSNASLFAITTGVISNENGTYASDDFVFGSPSLEDDTDTDHDSRMFFDKSKGAFRAGQATGAQWNDTNVGTSSIAMGYGTIASGEYSTAIGYYTTANATYSIAMGNASTASAAYSTAMGNDTTADGFYSTAMGIYTDATGLASTAMGNDTTASGDNSTAMGEVTTASGKSSMAVGRYTTANDYAEMTAGQYNIIGTGSQTVWTSTDNLFVIGNGIDGSNRSNALTILKSGKTTINAPADEALLTAQPTGGTTLAIATTGYVDGEITSNASLFAITTGVISNENGTYASDDFVFGSPQLADDTDTDHDVRMFFDKSKGAFRVGETREAQWDDANIGLISVAMGYNTTASGMYSTAMGNNTNASGDYSTAIGNNSIASGSRSTAMGADTTASGFISTAMGIDTTAFGNYSTAMGNNSNAHDYAEMTIGQYNIIGTGSYNTWTSTDNLFIIGNGIDGSNRSNALTILKSGKTTINAPADEALLTAQPTGGDDLAIATTKYVDDATSGSIQLDRPASAAAPVTTTCDELSEVGTLAYTYTATGQNGTNEGQVHVCVEYDNGGTQGYIWVVMTVFGS